MEASKLVIPLLFAGSLLGGHRLDWKTGSVTWGGEFPYTRPGLDISTPFTNSRGPLMAGRPPGIIQRLQIQGDPYVYNVSYVVNWHTPKVTVDGAILYALDKNGKFYIQDADGREYRVNIVNRLLSPPPAANAGNNLNWKTGRLNFVGTIPRYPAGIARPYEATQWLQIRGSSYVYDLTYIVTTHTPRLTAKSPVKYGFDQNGTFHILDENNLDFKVEVVRKARRPPPTRPAGIKSS